MSCDWQKKIGQRLQLCRRCERLVMLMIVAGTITTIGAMAWPELCRSWVAPVGVLGFLAFVVWLMLMPSDEFDRGA